MWTWMVAKVSTEGVGCFFLRTKRFFHQDEGTVWSSGCVLVESPIGFKEKVN